MNNQYKVRTITCLGCGRAITKRMPKNRKYCSLSCWRKSKHPERMTGKMVECEQCGKKIYKYKVNLKHKHHFCSLECANKWQGRDKLVFNCKVCGGEFKWSKSRIKSCNPTYCSIECRNKDKDGRLKISIKGNLAQQNKKGLNKLELAGRKILQDLGIKFDEQVLMFSKFLVDVLIRNKLIVIQWDGVYWHSKTKRKQLDKSQDAYLNKCKYTVIRITDDQIKNNLEGVYDYIKRTVC